MRCPFCGHQDTQVKDSRPSDDGASIRRRRLCPDCGARFTTYERVQLRELTVLKSTGKTEPFDRDKVMRSMKIAMRKRSVPEDQIERAVNSLVRQLEATGESEFTTKDIGEKVMETLLTLDKVGYIRYASVYKDFREAGDFSEFLGDLKEKVENEEKTIKDT